jgi:hypothetical protein
MNALRRHPLVRADIGDAIGGFDLSSQLSALRPFVFLSCVQCIFLVKKPHALEIIHRPKLNPGNRIGSLANRPSFVPYSRR